MKPFYWIIVLLFTSVGCLAAPDPQAIDDVLAQTQARQEASLLAQLNSTFPPIDTNSPPSLITWHYIDFAISAYWLDQRTDEADAALILCNTDTNIWNELINGPNGDEDSDEGSGHWQVYLLARIYLLFSSQSSYFPGRMSAAAEDAVLDMMWRWADGRCKLGHADVSTIHYYWGSENHHSQAWVSFWSAAQAFLADPDYQNRTYDDGTTVAAMAAAFDEYFKAYCRDRSLKGLTLETNSPTYAKYTLNTWLNLYDFATDPELKERAGAMLDIYWADFAIEHLGGVRGGSRHRSYPRRESVTGASAVGHSRMLLGFAGTAKHPGDMSAVSTFWRPSRAVIGMAIDEAGRGEFTYRSRRLGRKDLSPPPVPPAVGTDSGYNAFKPGGGSLLRTTWVTPEFIMGMSQVELLPTSDWVAVSTQNRWNGVIFSGDPNARLYTVAVYPDDKSYNAEWGVQNKGVMVLQRITESSATFGPLEQKVWFDESLTRSEISGWIFAVSEDAYAAVRVVHSGYVWENSVEFPSDGIYADLNDQFSPVIIEVAAKSDYASFTAFRLDLLDNPVVWDGTRLDYTSTRYDTTLTLFADESAPPRVDGVPTDMEPAQAYDSPYLQGDFAGGPVIIQYGDDRTIHGVAPFADEAGCFALWHFDELVSGTVADDTSVTGRMAVDAVVHPDSTNSISVIPDGKFGSAIRCADEAGDQYMMTGSSAWPAQRGTFRYQGWIRLNPGDAGGYLFHVYDQVYLSVDPSTVTLAINRSGLPADTSATNRIELSAAIDSSNDWQYVEAVYDGASIKLVTDVETVSAPGIGTFVPNVRNIYVGSRKNKSNFVGDMDEVKISSFPPDPVVVAADDENLVDLPATNAVTTNTISQFAPVTGANTKLVVTASWEQGTEGIAGVTYAGLPFVEAVSSDAGRQSSIWYRDLDELSPATGDLVVTFNAATDSRIGVLSLQNAAPGAPTQTVPVTGTTSVDISPSVNNSLVVGVYTENGNGALSSDFEHTLYSGNCGSSVGHAGYQLEASPGPKTYTWTAATNSCAVAAAVFAPAAYGAPNPIDEDEDGMEDRWEVERLGSLGASPGSSDTDGDFFTDLEEYQWGTDPMDAASRLHFTVDSPSTLRWSSVQGKRYTVQSATSPVNPSWGDIASGIPGEAVETTYPVTPTGPMEFFRLGVE